MVVGVRVGVEFALSNASLLVRAQDNIGIGIAVGAELRGDGLIRVPVGVGIAVLGVVVQHDADVDASLVGLDQALGDVGLGLCVGRVRNFELEPGHLNVLAGRNPVDDARQLLEDGVLLGLGAWRVVEDGLAEHRIRLSSHHGRGNHGEARRQHGKLPA